jgi:hypothetical protein
MNLEEWRKKQATGESFTLPSGLDVRLRKVGMLDLATQGKIPATLAPRINELMKPGGMATGNLEQVAEMAGVVDVVCQACLVWPEMSVTELSYEDRLAIFNWASTVSAKLSPFRGESTEPVAA